MHCFGGKSKRWIKESVIWIRAVVSHRNAGGAYDSRTDSYGFALNGIAGGSAKFLAKIASDWRKPDGLFVIQPEEIDSFLLPLPVSRLPGVGKVTEEKLKTLRVQTVGDLLSLDLSALERHFGRYGVRLHELARRIDDNRVIPDRPTQSISAEDTFEHDVTLTETEPMIRKLAEKMWSASRKELRIARTVVLKLKTSEFKIRTDQHRSVPARAHKPWPKATLSPGWRQPEQLLRL
jgi:nucleotidyltransferase/DNA polymerase involved in DNA repair